MKNLTKGEKNELERQKFQARKDAIKKHGYTVHSRKCGYGEYDVTLWKDGKCIHPGASYEYEFQVVDIAEKLIKNMKKYTQQYLITMDASEPFFSEWFDPENNFNPEYNMVVYDLINHIYTSNGINWKDIESDHL